MSDGEWCALDTNGACTNTREGSNHDVYVNITPICPNMSNQQFRAMVMRLRDEAIPMIDARHLALARYWGLEKERVKKWFGRCDDELKQQLLNGLPKLKAAMQELKPEKIVRYDYELGKLMSCTPAPPAPGVSAAVCRPDSAKRYIAIYKEFCTLPEKSGASIRKLRR